VEAAMMVSKNQLQELDVPFLNNVNWPAWPRFDDMFRDVEWRRPFKIEECRDDNVIVLRAELPGVDPDKDVQVEVVDDQLVITAQKYESHEKSARHVHHSEFRYGSMTRSVSVPKGVDESMISATYKDGVLEVRVAMPEVAVMDGAHRVPIKRV
jgi:HSP20 family protein